ncbi:hypothetical protein, partial [Thiolapillus sp.]|uniref:hypothetical protein n=1 Tax=Thiolapillus sp. TaxID=2017437 RepID=UPI0025DC1BAB
MKDFGTSQSPKSTRPLTTYWCPSRPDVCQDTCPFVYAASSLIPASSTPSFSGFNHTSPTGSQFRV